MALAVYLHGYIHCMPYGKVALVIRLSPLHPGYTMTVCADTRAVPTTAMSIEKSITLRTGCCAAAKLKIRRGSSNVFPRETLSLVVNRTLTCPRQQQVHSNSKVRTWLDQASEKSLYGQRFEIGANTVRADDSREGWVRSDRGIRDWRKRDKRRATKERKQAGIPEFRTQKVGLAGRKKKGRANAIEGGGGSRNGRLLKEKARKEEITTGGREHRENIKIYTGYSSVSPYGQAAICLPPFQLLFPCQTSLQRKGGMRTGYRAQWRERHTHAPPSKCVRYDALRPQGPRQCSKESHGHRRPPSFPLALQ